MNSIFLSGSHWPGVLLCVPVIAAAYFMGNISPAILIGRLHGIDIKKEGSGNAGTTNVLRVLGKKAAAGTLAVDILKGVAAVALGRLAGSFLLAEPDLLAAACCAAVFAGHIWPALFGFRGGKGIATGFGAIVTFQWQMGVGLLIVALLGMVLSRRVSVGSVLAALAMPAFAYYFQPDYLPVFTVMALIVIWKHRANIGRIRKGQEPKISFKKQEGLKKERKVN